MDKSPRGGRVEHQARVASLPRSYLQKESGGTGTGKYQPRWFVLKDFNLEYYDSSPTVSTLESRPLSPHCHTRAWRGLITRPPLLPSNASPLAPLPPSLARAVLKRLHASVCC